MTPDIPHARSVPSTRPSKSADAHGQAALLLVESLIHGLIGHGTITVDQAVDIVGSAGDVKGEIAPSMGESPNELYQSLILLEAIERSLSNDLQRPD